MTKFLSKPQGTRLSIVNSAGNMFPSITICPYSNSNENTGYNSTLLEECGITFNQYQKDEVWSNQAIESCKDPESLYYNVWNIWKSEDLISSVKIKSFKGFTSCFLGNKTALFSPVDVRFQGRCYTFLPPQQNLKEGIYQIKLLVKVMARVFVNNIGAIGVKPEAITNFVDISLNNTHKVNVDHSLYKVLDFQGSPCNNEKT